MTDFIESVIFRKEDKVPFSLSFSWLISSYTRIFLLELSKLLYFFIIIRFVRLLALRPLLEKQMESRLAGETEVLGENLPQRHFCPSQNPT
jgi:hypothetical protein